MTLYLVATPIGNLQDFSSRAIEILKHVDYILCEDTRHSSHLLRFYQIETPMKSFHRFNEKSREEKTVEDLKEGKNIALISDAGTPGISDPGEMLVKECIEENIKIVSIPGACAAIAAVVLSGFSTESFQFLGFLPKKEGDLKKKIIEILRYPGTTVCYESPHRLCALLKIFHSIAPKRRIAVARELTKHFEEIRRGVAEELLNHWNNEPVRGEIVFMISGAKNEESEWCNLSDLEHVDVLEKNYKLSKMEAIKLAAEMRGVPKREIYNKSLGKDKEINED